MINSKTFLTLSILDIEAFGIFLLIFLRLLIAYTYLPRKPTLDLEPKGLLALPPAVY